MARFGPRAKTSLPVLHQALDDPDPRVRLAVAEAVWDIGRRAAPVTPVLVQLLDSKRSDVQALAAYTLGGMGGAAKKALPDLRRILDHSEGLLKLHVAEAILNIRPGDQTAADVLDSFLDHDDDTMRAQAAHAITAVSSREQSQWRSATGWEAARTDPGPARFREPAAASVDDKTGNARQGAAKTAGSGSRDELQITIKKLVGQLDDDQASVRKQAAGRLAWIGEQAAPALPALVRRLEDDSPVVRAAAAWALWEIGHDAARAVPPLVELLDGGNTAQAVLAAYILGSIRGEAAAALPHLRKKMVDSKGLLRVHLAEAILKIDPSDRPAVDELVASLDDADAAVRSQAVYALAGIKPLYPERVSTALTGALKDDSKQVRRAAQESLAEFRLARSEFKPPMPAAARKAVEPPADPKRGRRALRAGSVTAAVRDSRFEPQVVAEPELLPPTRAPSRAGLSLGALEPVKAPVPRMIVSDQTLGPKRRPAASSLSLAAAESRHADSASLAKNRIGSGKSEVGTRKWEVGKKPATSRKERSAVGLATDLRQRSRVQPTPSAEAPPENEGKDTPDYYARPDIFTVDEPLADFIDALPYEEDGRRRPLPEDAPTDPERMRKLQDARAEAGLLAPPEFQPPGAGRGWLPAAYYWEAASLCHRPLYFEEINAERYGNTFGPAQPVVSAGRFFGTVPLLPYLLTVKPPHECVYTLGHYRPGSDIPYRHHCLPVRLDGALVEAATIYGMILVLH